MHIGSASIIFDKTPYIREYSSIVGPKEGNGPLKQYFDIIHEDDLFGGNSWENAESMMINENINNLITKAHYFESDIDYILSGDLLGQLMATSFAISSYNLPFFGLYGACSTFGEAISLGSILIASGYAKNVIASASSHFASAEKTFRFPLAYGSQRKFSATWTVTGCGSVILSDQIGLASIKGITTGRIVDYGLKDKENMGACMAPAAADTIYHNLNDLNISPNYYDKIITGDLGYVGQTILIKLLKEKGYDISSNHMDCGIEIFDKDTQDTHAGGSGCGCSASTFCSMIMKKLISHEYNRILFIPTGALLSPVSSNEGCSVPAIAHAVIIESV